MKHWKKRGFVLSLAGMIAAASLSGCSTSSVNNDEVLATVGDAEISYGVANFYARMVQSRYEDYYTNLMGSTPSEFWEQEFLGQIYEESVKNELIENLENMYLLRQHAEEYDVALTEEEQKAIQKAAADFEEENDLEAKELSSGYAKYIEEYLTIATIQNKMENSMKEGVDEEVSDEEAAQKSMKYVFFSYTKEEDGSSSEEESDDNGSKEMSDDEKEELKKTAEKFAEDLKDSKDKDIDAAAEKAGLVVETVTFDSETKQPDTDLIEAADKLKENEVTDVIETGSGLYVGVVTSLLDRKATDEKKDSIIEDRKDEQYNSLLDEWRGEVEITVNQELWESIDFANHGITDKKNQEAREGSAEGNSQSDAQQETENPTDEAAEE